MSDRETISFDISAEMALTLREAVESGDYQSRDDVLRDALQDWQLRRQQFGLTDTKSAELWDRGIASGPPGNTDGAFAGTHAEHDAGFKRKYVRRWRRLLRVKSDL